MYAFSNALRSIRNGDCDAAIVGGVAVDILPDVAETFTRLGMTSPDGKCKHLDNDGKFLYVKKSFGESPLRDGLSTRDYFCKPVAVFSCVKPKSDIKDTN